MYAFVHALHVRVCVGGTTPNRVLCIKAETIRTTIANTNTHLPIVVDTFPVSVER